MIGQIFHTLFRYAALTEVIGKNNVVHTQYDLPLGTSKLEILCNPAYRVSEGMNNFNLKTVIKFNPEGDVLEKSYFRPVQFKNESEVFSTSKYFWSEKKLQKIIDIKGTKENKHIFYYFKDATHYSLKSGTHNYDSFTKINNMKLNHVSRYNGNLNNSIWEFDDKNNTLDFFSCDSNSLLQRVKYNQSSLQINLFSYSTKGTDRYDYIYNNRNELEFINHFENDTLVDGIFIKREKERNEWQIYEQIYREGSELIESNFTTVFRFQ